MKQHQEQAPSPSVEFSVTLGPRRLLKRLRSHLWDDLGWPFGFRTEVWRSLGVLWEEFDVDSRANQA